MQTKTRLSSSRYPTTVKVSTNHSSTHFVAFDLRVQSGGPPLSREKRDLQVVCEQHFSASGQVIIMCVEACQLRSQS